VDEVARAKVAMARDHLLRGRPLRLEGEGTSMWPVVREGEVVEVLPLAGGGVREGDVVLAEGSAGLYLHRVLRLQGDRVLLKGDANPLPDGWVPVGALLGRLARRPWDRPLALAAPWLGPWLSRAARVRRWFFDRPPGPP
jgi:hypothetical protein